MEATLQDAPPIFGVPTPSADEPADVAPRAALSLAAAAVSPPAAGGPLSIRDTVLAQFRANEAPITALAERYRAVAFDCSTPKGLAAAKEARHDLRENGRFAVQRAEKRIKDEVNGLKKVMADEAERLIAIVQPVEDHVDAQIKAREEQIAAEKAEAARREAERRAKHEANLATLAGYAEQARGKDAATIARGLMYLETLELDAGAWEDYFERARTTLTATIATVRGLHAAAVQAEAEAAERERQRLENERRAAELAAQEQALAAQRAELARLEQEARDRIAALEREAADREAARIAALAPPPAPEPESVVEAPAAVAEEAPARLLPPAPPPLCEATIASAPVVAELPPAPAPAAVATLTAGQIGDRLKFRLPVEFIETTLGVTRADTRKGNPLWDEAAWPAIKDGLVQHVLGLA